MRYLAIDPGDKRVGLAVGDDETRIATPAGMIEVSSDDRLVLQLAKAIEDHLPGALVIGLPLNMDGTEGPAARKARALADRLTHRFQLPIHLVDERLSTHAADDQLRELKMTHRAKRAKRDALAAATILQDFLNGS